MLRIYIINCRFRVQRLSIPRFPSSTLLPSLTVGLLKKKQRMGTQDPENPIPLN